MVKNCCSLCVQGERNYDEGGMEIQVITKGEKAKEAIFAQDYYHK